MNMIKILIAWGFVLLPTVSAFAQQGTLRGVVVEDESSETVIGATVMIEGIGIGAATDVNGQYTIRNIPAGKHTVVVSYIGLQTLTITDVEIFPGQTVELDVLLTAGTNELDIVTVTAYRERSSISSVLMDIRSSSQVTSGISRQQIAISQDGNAAQVIQRVPGITIAENRFVFIRGLSERYNNVMINNSVAPSTEVDKRTFSFDLISSGSLDRMMVYKSGSADLPGDFAGGVIKLYTIDNVDANFLKLNVGFGYRTGTTGNNFMKSEGSSTDFIGFDSGFRQLPSSFPDTETLQSSPRNSNTRIENSHNLPNNFMPVESTAMNDYSLGVTFGTNGSLAGRKLSNITSIDYSNSYNSHQKEFYRYFEWEDRSQPILTRFDFRDDSYKQDNKVSVMTNWRLRVNDRNSISFKNLFNQIGENETIIRSGVDFIQRPDDLQRNYMLGYRSRSIYTGQLQGYHEVAENASVDWVVGSSLLLEKEPDLRRFRTFRVLNNPEERFSMQLPPSSNLFDTGRYYGDLNELSLNHGVDFTVAPTGRFRELKAGYLFDYRDRSFSSRYISYLYPGFFNPNVREELIRLPLDQIFSDENVRSLDGFVIEEGTRPIDSYDANSSTAAGYVSSRLEIRAVSLTGGLRLEHNRQRLQSRDDFQEIRVDNPVLTLLPFLNGALSLGDKTQVRAGYGRTINRPEFRELAPFVFYDYKLDAGRSGNPSLEHSTIDNIDLRVEFYPRIGETLTIGAFYKYFDKPIENKTTVTTESPQFGYINAENAYSYGFEAEIRKSFQGITPWKFIDRLSTNLNASLIFTEVDLGDGAVAQESKRPLQGQSPYIINSALYYDHPGNLSVSAVYNLIGPRIFSVGDVLFPTIYEMPRNSLDLSVTKELTTKSSLKLGVQNVLNSANQFFQDSDRNGRIDKNVDQSIVSFRSGQLVNVSFSYSL